MGRFIGIALSIGVLVVGFNLTSGLVDSWLASTRLSGSAANAQAPATAAAPVTPAGTGSATGSIAAAPATGSAPATTSAPAAAAPATGSATTSVAVATPEPADPLQPVYDTDLEGLVHGGVQAAILQNPLQRIAATSANLFNVNFFGGVLSTRMGGQSAKEVPGKSPMQVGVMVVPDPVYQGLRPSEIAGYAILTPQVGYQVAAVFGGRAGELGDYGDGMAAEVVPIFGQQIAKQKQDDSTYVIAGVEFTGAITSPLFKAGFLQNYLSNDGRVAAGGPVLKGPVQVQDMNYDGRPDWVAANLMPVSGRPYRVSGQVACDGWNNCAHLLGEELASSLLDNQAANEAPPNSGGGYQSTTGGPTPAPATTP